MESGTEHRRPRDHPPADTPAVWPIMRESSAYFRLGAGHPGWPEWRPSGISRILYSRRRRRCDHRLGRIRGSASGERDWQKIETSWKKIVNDAAAYLKLHRQPQPKCATGGIGGDRPFVYR
jgi:hypothetical protein